jgi:hypothetical protein
MDGFDPEMVPNVRHRQSLHRPARNRPQSLHRPAQNSLDRLLADVMMKKRRISATPREPERVRCPGRFEKNNFVVVS